MCRERRKRGEFDVPLRRRPRRGRSGRDGGAGYWEPAAYWLLYVVALAAVPLHWRSENHALAVLCGAAVLFSVRMITRTYGRGGS
ncbi:hypothetical protein [Marinitenerispora sediminis]|uniref:Uncharacterized protein n=1 Tax=Marinitenerispora sediminis TaxID=1931232 RepID=A0A368T9Q7_9ACTN|nr:hypothetical protein [Marinitenerispora sediminis]RCV61095.1 hypothetical protein DEF24_05045 [Marinitenerispora sediminis]